MGTKRNSEHAKGRPNHVFLDPDPAHDLQGSTWKASLFGAGIPRAHGLAESPAVLEGALLQGTLSPSLHPGHGPRPRASAASAQRLQGGPGSPAPASGAPPAPWGSRPRPRSPTARRRKSGDPDSKGRSRLPRPRPRGGRASACCWATGRDRAIAAREAAQAVPGPGQGLAVTLCGSRWRESQPGNERGRNRKRFK